MTGPSGAGSRAKWGGRDGGKTPRLLVVDDDESLRLLIETALGCRGFDVVAAGSVAEATAEAQLQSVDLALVDLRLPDGNGADLLAALHARDPSLPVIVLTGDRSVDSAVAAVNQGAAAYFLKPLVLDEVITAAEQLLDKRRLLQDNRRLELELRRELEEKRAAIAALSRHHAAVEAVAEAIVVTDRRGFVEYVNPAFEVITGYSKEEIRGRDLHVLDSGRHGESFYAALRADLGRQGTWSGQLESCRKDHSPFHEACTISPLRDDEGVITGYAHVRRDVTEELRLRSVADAVNTMDSLGYVFSGIRHELGNPVNSATFALRMLAGHAGELEPSSVTGYLERTIAELAKVTRLLGLLRSFDAFESVDVCPVEVRPFLDAFVALARPDCARRAVTLEATVASGVTSVSADPRALQTVLLNVLANALDASAGREAGAVRIAARRDGATIAISVADEGAGMTPERRATLFRPFATTKADHKGLGLLVCRRLMSQMGGSIAVDGREGGGTTVVLGLPVATT